MNCICSRKNVERGAAPLHTSPRQGRTRPWTRALLGVASLAALSFIATCSPKEPQWPRPEASSLSLDLDQVDCRATAEAMAREASTLGQRPLPDVAWRVYLHCMVSKGWVVENSEAFDTSCAETPVMNGNAIQPPDGFVLLERSQHDLDPASTCAYSYPGPQGAILRLEVQRSTDGFLSAAAPVMADSMIVDRGLDMIGDLELVWVAAIENRNGVDVLVFTAFASGGKTRERLFVATAVPLESDAGPEPHGLRMSHARRKTALEMARMWREWLARTLDER